MVKAALTPIWDAAPFSGSRRQVARHSAAPRPLDRRRRDGIQSVSQPESKTDMPPRSALVLIPLIALVQPAAAQSGCASAIAGFRAVIDSDAKAGQLERSVSNRMAPELDRVAQICRGGHDGE